MAYARFARDSDVYVYADGGGGFTCERCPRAGQDFRCRTAAEMVTHLIMHHRANGERVPDEAIDALRGETALDGSLVEVMYGAERKLKAEIEWRPDGLFQVWVFREVPGDGPFEPDVFWSPVGKDAILTDSLERAKALADDALRSSGGR